MRRNYPSYDNYRVTGGVVKCPPTNFRQYLFPSLLLILILGGSGNNTHAENSEKFHAKITLEGHFSSCNLPGLLPILPYLLIGKRPTNSRSDMKFTDTGTHFRWYYRGLRCRYGQFIGLIGGLFVTSLTPVSCTKPLFFFVFLGRSNKNHSTKTCTVPIIEAFRVQYGKFVDPHLRPLGPISTLLWGVKPLSFRFLRVW